MSDAQPIAIWAGPNQEPLIDDALATTNFVVAAIGSDDVALASNLATRFGAERLTELRRTARFENADLLWLAAPTGEDGDAALRTRESGPAVVATSEPIPTTVSSAMNVGSADPAIFVPLFRRAPGFSAAKDLFDDFGTASCVNVFFRSGPGEGSLFARLFDAMEIVDGLCGAAEVMHASLVSPHDRVPDALENLTGHLTLNMHFADNRCACVAVSDRGGRWFRGVTLLGDGGCLRISDTNCEWIGPDGATVDEYRDDAPATCGALVGRQLLRALDRLDTADPPLNMPRLLALCEATRLSCRTGQAEAPRKMLQMLKGP